MTGKRRGIDRMAMEHHVDIGAHAQNISRWKQIAFLNAAIAYYASLGVTISRVMTDNGGCR